jgi:hypothetical protein
VLLAVLEAGPAEPAFLWLLVPLPARRQTKPFLLPTTPPLSSAPRFLPTIALHLLTHCQHWLVLPPAACPLSVDCNHRVLVGPCARSGVPAATAGRRIRKRALPLLVAAPASLSSPGGAPAAPGTREGAGGMPSALLTQATGCPRPLARAKRRQIALSSCSWSAPSFQHESRDLHIVGVRGYVTCLSVFPALLPDARRRLRGGRVLEKQYKVRFEQGQR